MPSQCIWLFRDHKLGTLYSFNFLLLVIIVNLPLMTRNKTFKMKSLLAFLWGQQREWCGDCDSPVNFERELLGAEESSLE